MDSRKIIHDCVLYINTHLKEQLSLEGLAEQAGFSPYYFSRLFTLYMEIPVMEYVHRRRLACAADDLCTGKRVLDVAMDYGFESHSGFAKAFRKIYGFSPNEYRNRMTLHRPIAPNPLAGVASVVTAPTVRVEDREGFYVAGMVVMTGAAVSSIAQQPALWDRVWLAEQENKIYALANPRQHGEYYISFPVKNDLYRLVTCVKIEDPEELGIPFVEEDIMIYDGVNAEEAWVTTTPYCIAPVSKFNGQQLGDGTTPVFRKLLEAWGKRVGKDLWKELTEAQPIQYR